MATTGNRGHKGVWRVYFNTRTDYPMVWSVDDGDPTREGNFAQVVINGHAVSRYKNEGGIQPIAWLEVAGEMQVIHGTAVIWGELHTRQGEGK